MKFYATRKVLVGVILVLCAIIFLLTMTGCKAGSSTLKEFETGKVVGTLNGHPVEIAWQRNKDGNTEFHINVPTSAPAAAAGLLTGGTSTGILALITAAVTAWGAAQKKRADGEERRANEHKADSDDGWSRLFALQNALKVPPKDNP